MNETIVTITGWLGSDVTLQRAGEHSVATFRVGSTPRRFRDGGWVDGKTTWFQVKAWRRAAEHAAVSLRRGDPVIVQGRLSVELWEREDGVSVSRHVVVATSLGHDLTHGTSSFSRPGSAPAVDSAAGHETAPSVGPSAEQSSSHPTAPEAA